MSSLGEKDDVQEGRDKQHDQETTGRAEQTSTVVKPATVSGGRAVEEPDKDSGTSMDSVQKSPNTGPTTADDDDRLNAASTSSKPSNEAGTKSGKRKKRRLNSFNKEPSEITKKKKLNHNFLPNKFLLGGNIADPLNLKGDGEDMEHHQQEEFDNFVTPACPKDHRIPINLPADIYDPLRLQSDGPLISEKPVPWKLRRSKKNTTNAGDFPTQSLATNVMSTKKVNKDQIVSPAIKQNYSSVNIHKSRADRRRTLSLRLDNHEPARNKRGKKKQSGSGEIPDGKQQQQQKRGNSDQTQIDQGRTTEEVDNLIKNVTFNHKDQQFPYGNYSRYYGYRCDNKFHDPRINSLQRDWFKDKDVLDVGCNSGQLTLLIARDFSPRKIVGVDIDEKLVNAARSNVRHYASSAMSVTGPPLETGAGDESANFPNNVNFHQGNYVPETPMSIDVQEPEYDVIMCLSVTKWLHLNFGDEGLKKTFKRIFKQLRPGGKLIIEPQPWKSYHKRKKINATVYRNYLTIQMKPEHFSRYLVDEIGFGNPVTLKPTDKQTGGFNHRPLLLFTKPE